MLNMKLGFELAFSKSDGTTIPDRIFELGCKLLDKCMDKRKLSKPAQEAMEQWADTKTDGTGKEKPSPEVVEEVKSWVSKVLEEQVSPVYADGVFFFTEEPMDEETQERLAEIVTHVNGEDEPCDDEEDAKYQAVVDEFVESHMGSFITINGDCYIGEWYISMDFAGCGDADDCVCCEDDMRRLAVALNHLLGDKYITGFHVF